MCAFEQRALSSIFNISDVSSSLHIIQRSILPFVRRLFVNVVHNNIYCSGAAASVMRAKQKLHMHCQLILLMSLRNKCTEHLKRNISNNDGMNYTIEWQTNNRKKKYLFVIESSSSSHARHHNWQLVFCRRVRFHARISRNFAFRFFSSSSRFFLFCCSCVPFFERISFDHSATLYSCILTFASMCECAARRVDWRLHDNWVFQQKSN